MVVIRKVVMKKALIIAIAIAGGLTTIDLSYGIETPDNNNQVIESSEVITTEEPTTTTITTTTTTTKKVVKTTKKNTQTRKVYSNYSESFNIKASKQEIKDYAYKKVVEKWGEENWSAFDNIVQRESGWNPNSINKKSGACGLFQFVPCSKGGNAYKTDYKVQVDKGIQYISSRYGTPNEAWDFWQKHHWY